MRLKGPGTREDTRFKSRFRAARNSGDRGVLKRREEPLGPLRYCCARLASYSSLKRESRGAVGTATARWDGGGPKSGPDLLGAKEAQDD